MLTSGPKKGSARFLCRGLRLSLVPQDLLAALIVMLRKLQKFLLRSLQASLNAGIITKITRL